MMSVLINYTFTLSRKRWPFEEDSSKERFEMKMSYTVYANRTVHDSKIGYVLYEVATKYS